MKYAIISDIHSNYEAFYCVLEDIKNEKVDKIYCCGDIVGYGPSPNECIELIREYSIVSVVGNHDVAVLGKTELSWFNETAREAIKINQSLLNKQNLDFLNFLPQKIEEDKFLIVHGSPRDYIYEYLLTVQSLRINIKLFNQQICFCGHTHIPVVYSFNFSNGEENILIPEGDEYLVEINNDTKYIVNVGSIGQPRDGNPKSCYVIFDIDNNIIKYKRLEYNISLVQEKMKLLNIPHFLITRLEFGE
jgi:predicted phosphodiesterase